MKTRFKAVREMNLEAVQRFDLDRGSNKLKVSSCSPFLLGRV